MPRLCEFYPGICLTTEEEAWKNLSQGKKNLSHSTVYILPKTPTHNKALTNAHVTKPTHTHTHAHTHTTKQYKTTTVQYRQNLRKALIRVVGVPPTRKLTSPRIKAWILTS